MAYVAGRVLARAGTELVLDIEPRPLRVPATSIDTLWTRAKATGTGALIGGLLGAGAWVLLPGRECLIRDSWLGRRTLLILPHPEFGQRMRHKARRPRAVR